MLTRISYFIPPLYLPPLIGIAIAYIGGIFLYWVHRSNLLSNTVLAVGCMFAIALVVYLLWRYTERRKAISLHIIFLALGCWRSHSAYSSFEHFPFAEYTAPVTIRGVITGSSYSSKSRMNYCLTLLAQEIEDANNSIRNINNTLQIYLSQKPSLVVGDTIEIYNAKLAPPNNKDFKEYLIKEGVIASLFITHFSYKLIHRPYYSMHRWLWGLRDQIVSGISKKLSAPIHAFFCAIFLGNRTINKKQVEILSDHFKQWGAVHYIVRAGLHLVMFVGIWFSLLSIIPINFALKQIFMIILCLLYYLLSWSSIAFMRAFLTFLLYKGATLINVNTHSLHVITLVTLLVLIANPLQLFFLDFQLSFSVTFALAWFNHMYISSPAQTL